MNTNTERMHKAAAASPISTAKLVILAIIAILFFSVAILSHSKPGFLPATFDLNMTDSSTWQQSNL